MPSAQNIHPNGTGEMLSFCFTAAALMKCCATIWEESFAKINFHLFPYPLMGEGEDGVKL